MSKYKFCLELLKSTYLKKVACNSKISSLGLSNVLHRNMSVKAILTRPKALDKLNEFKKKKKEKNKEYEYKRGDEAYTEFGAYGFFLCTIPVITFCLGTWQIERRRLKLELIKDLNDKLLRDPVELPENLDNLVNLEYCPIIAKGEFLYDKEFIIGPKGLIVNGQGATEGRGNLISGSSTNKGFNIITPFKLEDRDLVILVNRGWVPHTYKQEKLRKELQVDGTIEITGINRLNETRPQFIMKNDPKNNIWLYRDVFAMAEFAETQPIFLDMLQPKSSSTLPIGNQTRVNLRNEHLSYIITWYGLTALIGYYCYRIFILKKPIIL